MITIMLVRCPLKIASAVICFFSVAMIYLRETVWIRDESNADQTMHEPNSLAQIDALIAFWAKAFQFENLAAYFPWAYLASAVRGNSVNSAFNPAKATERTSFVALWESWNITPLLHEVHLTTTRPPGSGKRTFRA